MGGCRRSDTFNEDDNPCPSRCWFPLTNCSAQAHPLGQQHREAAGMVSIGHWRNGGQFTGQMKNLSLSFVPVLMSVSGAPKERNSIMTAWWARFPRAQVGWFGVASPGGVLGLLYFIPAESMPKFTLAYCRSMLSHPSRPCSLEVDSSSRTTHLSTQQRRRKQQLPPRKSGLS